MIRLMSASCVGIYFLVCLWANGWAQSAAGDGGLDTVAEANGPSSSAGGDLATHESESRQRQANTAATSVTEHSQEYWRQKRMDIREKLLQPFEVEFSDAPLENVCQVLEKRLGISCLIDRPGLETLGLDASSLTITFIGHGMSIASALDELLRPHELTYIVRDGYLLVTSFEEAEHILEVNVYAVEELLNADTPLQSLQALKRLLLQTIEPHSWENTGGHGAISMYQSTLVINQTPRVHDQIEDLLSRLRSAVMQAGGPRLPEIDPRGARTGSPPVRERFLRGR